MAQESRNNSWGVILITLASVHGSKEFSRLGNRGGKTHNRIGLYYSLNMVLGM